MAAHGMDWAHLMDAGAGCASKAGWPVLPRSAARKAIVCTVLPSPARGGPSHPKSSHQPADKSCAKYAVFRSQYRHKQFSIHCLTVRMSWPTSARMQPMGTLPYPD